VSVSGFFATMKTSSTVLPSPLHNGRASKSRKRGLDNER